MLAHRSIPGRIGFCGAPPGVLAAQLFQTGVAEYLTGPLEVNLLFPYHVVPGDLHRVVQQEAGALGVLNVSNSEERVLNCGVLVPHSCHRSLVFRRFSLEVIEQQIVFNVTVALDGAVEPFRLALHLVQTGLLTRCFDRI